MPNSLGNYLSLIKFSHTIFALPFALLGFFLAVLDDGTMSWRVLLLVILCMVFARSAAMAFNRWRDRHIDGANPRTAVREIPAGVISSRNALFFIIFNCVAFVVCAGLLNPLCLLLSPVALLIILGYSYTKEFTSLCHFVLGLGLALAPVGAYLALTAHFAVLPVLYGCVVLLWVSGFDIIYSLQDEEFDRSQSLNSIPVRLGRRGALRLGRVLHIICAMVLILSVYLQVMVHGESATLTIIGGAVFLAALLYQHSIVDAEDLSNINLAFFTTNGVASVVFGALCILDIYV
ncbi:UbiA-like polyprenyltransferase [Lewinella sp. 4G2]|uniref:UbiA-like polyprenyltransferase n=1 Tax=Lewinella sp. 4G2 TaxID=1803372 RepID=UPI0007B49496|nr:UbiA-like polyprenyltransferase [Lewinella sp. 4G2]OAV45493.1 4-hydroxybenzoate octaprenyltransferase [Lewinella sp. 4G2]